MAAALVAGAAGGAVSARVGEGNDAAGSSSSSSSSAVATLRATAAASPVAPVAVRSGVAIATDARADVSALIDAALPAVVSIDVTGPQGSGAGSGFVIAADGVIATNAHVVADATSIRVRFHDGATADATVVGIDRSDDLAVVHVDRTGLRALPLGSSTQLRMGVPVVAIGNALALTGGPTATEGIVSALDRRIDTAEGGHLAHLIQTDAAINPGNSGGPLLTTDGRVVGINSAGSTGAQNIGFAIAIDTAKPIIAQLQRGKSISRAYLGVTTTQVDSGVASAYGLGVDHGLLVVDIAGQSAAEAAGLRAGDVIVSADGKPLAESAALADAIAAAGPGARISLTVFRDGRTLTLSATLSSHLA